MDTIDVKDLIKRARHIGLNASQIAYVIQIDTDTVQAIIDKNGWYSNKRPGCMPDSYFIDRISQGYSIQDMAIELQCSRDSVYKLLRKRNISVDAYRPSQLD